MGPAKGRIAPKQFEPLALREELQALVHHYRHLQNEHHRAPVESSLRRRIEERLLDVRERVDRLLEEWIEDEDLRNAWREHLHNRAPEPDGPEAIRPLVFRGVTEAGSDVEVREKSGDELEVRIDGALIERIAAEEDFASTVTPLRVRLDGFRAEETFSASAEALDALARFVESDDPPPWDFASELLADGLIDVHVALTPRGRRALAGKT
jgi:hypothetical protein